MTTPTARERFEAWLDRWHGGNELRYDLTRRDPPSAEIYLDDEVEIKWQAYQAGRLAGMREMRELAVNVSPNGVDVGGDDDPYTVWMKARQALRSIKIK